MAKAELAAAAQTYDAIVRASRAAESAGDYAAAVRTAASAWEHLEGMMQYRRKYEQLDFRSVPCIDMVLKHAPLVLDHEVLDTLSDLLKKRKAIDRNASDDLAQRVVAAKALMRTAHRLWDHIETQDDFMQSRLRATLGGEQDQWRWIAERWESMGLLRRQRERNSYRLALVTDLDDSVNAKCFECGAIATGRKGDFLGGFHCLECERTTSFSLQPVPDGEDSSEPLP